MKIMLKSNYNSIRILAGVLTVLTIVVHMQIPKKRIGLFDDPAHSQFLFSQTSAAAPKATRWINEKARIWECDNDPADVTSCGYSLQLSADLTKGMDFSEFESIEISLKYTGDSKYIRYFLRNYNSLGFEDQEVSLDTAKYLYTLMRTQDLTSNLSIPLNEFRVADWWITEMNAPREASAPDFTNMVVFGIDIFSSGHSHVELQNIELVGEYLSKEHLYLAIVILWMFILVTEGVIKSSKLFRQSRQDTKVIRELAKNYTELQEKKQLYENLAITDPLTGIMNRSGLQRFIDQLHAEDNKSGIGLMLIDIDHFKRVNDTRGTTSAIESCSRWRKLWRRIPAILML